MGPETLVVKGCWNIKSCCSGGCGRSGGGGGGRSDCGAGGGHSDCGGGGAVAQPPVDL